MWVHLPNDNREEKVEPINLILDETDEFIEVAKKYILNGMREYNQCFIAIMAYNLMWIYAGSPRFSTSPMIDLGTYILCIEIAWMNGSRSTSDGTEMQWKSKRQREACSYTEDRLGTT